MLKHYFFFFGYACLFSSLIYCENAQDLALPNLQYQVHPTKEIAYRNKQNFRRGNWDYKANWRYHKEAFFRGDTQPEAVEQEYLDRRPPGIGDPNDDYWQYYYQYYHRPFYDGAALNQRE